MNLELSSFENEVIERIKQVLGEDEFKEFLKHYEELKKDKEIKNKSELAVIAFLAFRFVKRIPLKRFSKMIGKSGGMMHYGAKTLFNKSVKNLLKEFNLEQLEELKEFENMIIERIKQSLSEEEFKTFMNHYEELKKGRVLTRKSDFALFAFLAFRFVKYISEGEFLRMIRVHHDAMCYSVKRIFNKKDVRTLLKELNLEPQKKQSEELKKAIQFLNDFMQSQSRIKLLEVDNKMKKQIRYAVKQYKYPIEVSCSGNVVVLKKKVVNMIDLIEEFKKKYSINESRIMQLYSLVENEGREESKKVATALYVHLRETGQLDAEAKKRLKDLIDMHLMCIINKYCEICLDLKSSVKNTVLRRLNEEEKAEFEKSYEELVSRFSKTMSKCDYIACAFVALSRIREVTREEFVKWFGITSVALRLAIERNKLKDELKQNIKELVKQEALKAIPDNKKDEFVRAYEEIVSLADPRNRTEFMACAILASNSDEIKKALLERFPISQPRMKIVLREVKKAINKRYV